MSFGVSLLSTLMLAQNGAVDDRRSLFDSIQDGGGIGYVIILLSFVALGLIGRDLFRLRRAKLAPPEVAGRLEELLKKGDVRGAVQVCRDPASDSFLARVFGSALVRCARSPFGMLEIKTALEEAGQLESAKLYRATDGVGLIASIAPMLGLLGTVVGMVGAFDTISVTQGVAKPDQLAGSISQALVTTVMGLLVAIPATAAYSYLRNRIDALVSEVAQTSEDLAALVEQRSQGPAATRGQGQGGGQRRQPPAGG